MTSCWNSMNISNLDTLLVMLSWPSWHSWTRSWNRYILQQLCILKHWGLPLPSINCHIIQFSHVFVLLHKTIWSYFSHNCPDGSKVFLVPLFANFVTFFNQVSQNIKCRAGLHCHVVIPRILLFRGHRNRKPTWCHLWDLWNCRRSLSWWWEWGELL